MENKQITGAEFYEDLEAAKNAPFESLDEKDQFIFNLVAETAEEVWAEAQKLKMSGTLNFLADKDVQTLRAALCAIDSELTDLRKFAAINVAKIERKEAVKRAYQRLLAIKERQFLGRIRA